MKKRREAKLANKEAKKMGKYINLAPQTDKSERLNVFAGGKRMHEMLRAPTDFYSNGDYLKKCALPSLSDFVYPVLMDCDPT